MSRLPLLGGARSAHHTPEHQPHEHIARLLVLHEGVSHLIIALENMDRAAHEFCVEAVFHHLRRVMSTPE